MMTENKSAESPTYWMLRRLKALRDSGIDVTMDDLFSVAEKGDRYLSVEELVDGAEAAAFYRRRRAG